MKNNIIIYYIILGAVIKLYQQFPKLFLTYSTSENKLFDSLISDNLLKLGTILLYYIIFK